jgi:hypothetical protein
MSKLALARAGERYAKVSELVQGQRQRVALLSAMGPPSAARRAADLLVIFEDVLEICRQSLELRRHTCAAAPREHVPANDG